MLEFIKNWTKEEYKAYILIYCAHADFVETKEEIDLIKSTISESVFSKIHREFEADNDYQQFQKIKQNCKKFYATTEQLNGLFDEIKTLMLSDGKYDILEENLFRALKHQLIENK